MGSDGRWVTCLLEETVTPVPRLTWTVDGLPNIIIIINIWYMSHFLWFWIPGFLRALNIDSVPTNQSDGNGGA